LIQEGAPQAALKMLVKMQKIVRETFGEILLRVRAVKVDVLAAERLP